MNLDTVIFIHHYLVEYFSNSEDPISPPGIKNKNMLESAIVRPFSSAGGSDAFPTIFEKASALFHGLISNHAFHNGNKRVSLLSTLYFLGDNGFIVDRCDDNEMFDFTRKVAAHEICINRHDEISIICEWFSQNSRKQIKGEQRLKFTELREILIKFGYNIENSGRYLTITSNGHFTTKILKKGMHGLEEYDQNYISNLRKKLKLTADYGIDSAMFYNNKGIAEDLNEFMEMRSEVMRKLAKI